MEYSWTIRYDLNCQSKLQNTLLLFGLLIFLASQLTRWSSWDVTGKWIHPVFLSVRSSIVPSKTTRLLITQIQGFCVPFSDCVCFMSKEPHSEVRKQMSRHSIFVNTGRSESFISPFASRRPGFWLCKISCKCFVALWHDWQGWEKENIRKKLQKNVDKFAVDISLTVSCEIAKENVDKT